MRSSVYLQDRGWLWKEGRYRGVSMGDAIFPTREPISNLVIYGFFPGAGSDPLNQNHITIGVEPNRAHMYNRSSQYIDGGGRVSMDKYGGQDIGRIIIPWRTNTSNSYSGLTYNVTPAIFVSPVEISDNVAELAFGFGDQIRESHLNGWKYPSYFMTGTVTMTEAAGSTLFEDFDYTHVINTEKEENMYTMSFNATTREAIKAMTSYGARMANLEKYTLATDGVNKFQKVI